MTPRHIAEAVGVLLATYPAGDVPSDSSGAVEDVYKEEFGPADVTHLWSKYSAA